MPHRAGRRELKPAQRLGLAALNEGTTNELTREQYQQLTGVSRSQAAYDLAELVETGLIERVGGGRSTRYRRGPRSQSSQRHWTNERIQAGLVGFCANRTTWPTAGDFKAAGHADLYVAASRYGGIGFWASQLGFSRTAPVEPQRPARSIRPLLRWAPVGIALAAVLFGVAGAVTQPRRPAPIREAAAAPVTPRITAPTRPARTAPVPAAGAADEHAHRPTEPGTGGAPGRARRATRRGERRLTGEAGNGPALDDRLRPRAPAGTVGRR